MSGEAIVRPEPGAATIPWTDRPGEDEHVRVPPPVAPPRSQRDLEILRGLARRINPHDAGAHNNLGVVYYNKGLYEEAIDQFELALELDADMQVAERNLQIVYFGTGYFDRLVADLRARLEVEPDDTEARARLARALLHTGDPDAALVEWEEVGSRSPDDARVHEYIARVQMRRGDQDEALGALRRAATLNPQDARLQLQIGTVMYRRGAAAEAREPLETAVARDPGLAEAFHLLAFVYGDLGMEDRAARASKRAAELNPSYTKTEANLSIDSHSRARYEELIGDRQHKPAVAEGGALAHYNLGLAFRQKALYDEALREFRLAAERGEDQFLVHQAQAEMLLLRGAGADAVPLYGALLEIEASSPKLWNELGVAHHQIGEFADARSAYERALDIDPMYALACSNFAVAQLHAGDVQAAEQLFRRSIENRAVADVWRNLGLLLHRTGRAVEAAQAYREALEIDPHLVTAWAGLGEILLEQQQPAEARNALIRAVELDANFAEARYRLAFAMSALGDYQGALRETRHALELNPYIPTPRFRLLIDLQFEEASILAPELDIAEQVDSGAAIEAFEFAPGSLDDLFQRADPLAGLPAQGAATPAHAAPVPDPAPQIEAALGNARRHLAAGALEEAQADAQQALRLGADRLTVQLLLGDIFLRRGLAGEAVERFAGALDALGDDDDSPETRQALRGLARALLDLERGSDAHACAARLARLVPDNTPVLRLLGEAALAAGDVEGAQGALERARAIAPDDVPTLVLLGATHAHAGDQQAAEQALRRALQLDELAVAARVALGGVYAAQERIDDAAREFRAALDVLPSYGEAAFALADLECRRDRRRAAVHVLVDLLIIDPYHLDALVRLGEMLGALGRRAEAAVAFRRVLHFDPGHQDALTGLEGLSPSAVAAREWSD